MREKYFAMIDRPQKDASCAARHFGACHLGDLELRLKRTGRVTDRRFVFKKCRILAGLDNVQDHFRRSLGNVKL